MDVVECIHKLSPLDFNTECWSLNKIDKVINWDILDAYSRGL